MFEVLFYADCRVEILKSGFLSTRYQALFQRFQVSSMYLKWYFSPLNKEEGCKIIDVLLTEALNINSIFCLEVEPSCKKNCSMKMLSICLLAHLSRRLIGELIVYPWSGVRCPSVVVRRPQCSNIFSETAWPIRAKFFVEPPWVGGTKFCSRHLGHMTKMAATPIYGKNPSKIFFSRTGGPISRNLVCSIGDSSPS